MDRGDIEKYESMTNFLGLSGSQFTYHVSRYYPEFRQALTQRAMCLYIASDPSMNNVISAYTSANRGTETDFIGLILNSSKSASVVQGYNQYQVNGKKY